MKSTLFLTCILLACGLFSTDANAQLIVLTNAGTSTGDNLDELDATDIGTASATVPVVEIPGLNITLTGIMGAVDSSLNSVSGALGVDATGTVEGEDTSDGFDSALSESATFQFDQTVSISEIDFVSFTTGEVFVFAGQTITFADITSSVYTPSTPLVISANTDFTLEATSGTIGIEGITLVEAIPEPSTVAVLALGSLGLFTRRRR